ncbi:hypothetical protein PM082_024667 [Marasmius tenuissimus]|nr:hypothetical protein PM082_024667 [Marasmius tenuissimus]
MSDYAVLPPSDYNYNPKTLSYMEDAGRQKPPYPLDGAGDPPKLPEQPLFNENTSRSRSASIDSHLEELHRYEGTLRKWKDRCDVYDEERRRFLHWHKIYVQCEHAIESQDSNEDSEEDDGEMPVKSTKEVRHASGSKRSRADSDESGVEAVKIQRISERLKTRTVRPATKAIQPPTPSGRVNTWSTEGYMEGDENKESCGRCLVKGIKCSKTLSRSPSKEYKGKRCWRCNTGHYICNFGEVSKAREPRTMKSGSRHAKVDVNSDTRQDVSRVLRGLKKTINDLQMKVDVM